jgi:glutamyl-tRNA synthetase
MRADGIEPAALVAYLARLGTSADIAPAGWEELAAGFEPGAISRSPARFDPAQLLALNRRVLHALPFEAVRERLPEGATEAFWGAVRGNLDMLSEARHWWDVVAGSIVPPPIEAEEDRAFLAAAAAALPAGAYDGATFKAWTEALKDGTGRKGRALFRPLRLALTGEEHGPELKDLLPLMGRDRAVLRLTMAAGDAS